MRISRWHPHKRGKIVKNNFDGAPFFCNTLESFKCLLNFIFTTTPTSNQATIHTLNLQISKLRHRDENFSVHGKACKLKIPDTFYTLRPWIAIATWSIKIPRSTHFHLLAQLCFKLSFIQSLNILSVEILLRSCERSLDPSNKKNNNLVLSTLHIDYLNEK